MHIVPPSYLFFAIAFFSLLFKNITKSFVGIWNESIFHFKIGFYSSGSLGCPITNSFFGMLCIFSAVTCA